MEQGGSGLAFNSGHEKSGDQWTGVAEQVGAEQGLNSTLPWQVKLDL